MTDSPKIPVLIVGAGPTGLTLAIECARHGVPFRLIDQNLARSPYSKALGIWHGTMQVLQAQGLLPQFLKDSIMIQQVAFADKGRIVGKVNPHLFRFRDLDGPIALAQSETERLLEEKLKTLEGHVERGLTLIEYQDHGSYIEAKLTDQNGEEEIVQALYLAGCDGARSITRKTLEQHHVTEFTGYTEPATFILGDVEYEGPYENNQIMISWGNNGSVALFPVTPNVLRIVSVRKPDSDAQPTLEEFQSLMDRFGPQGLKLKNPSWLSIFKINERLSKIYQQGRVFLLGDAAHIHSPAGGQGMNTGMQDAYNLGWKLAFLTQQPQLNLQLAASYEQERRPIAKKVVEEAAQKIKIGMYQNPLLRIVKNCMIPVLTRFKPFTHKMVAELSELFIEYPHSTLTIRKASLPKAMRPGMKWPFFTEIPSERFIHTKHVIVKFLCSPAEWEAFYHTAQSILQGLPCEFIVICATASNPEHQDWHYLPFDSTKWICKSFETSNWYLIRPDQFIAAGGQGLDCADLRKYLEVLGAATVTKHKT